MILIVMITVFVVLAIIIGFVIKYRTKWLVPNDIDFDL